MGLRHKGATKHSRYILECVAETVVKMATSSEPLPSAVGAPNYALDNRIAEDLPQTRQCAAARHKMNYSAMLASF